MAVGTCKMESESWQVIFPSRLRHFHPSRTQLKMLKCISCRNYSERIFWLWWSKIIHAFRRSIRIKLTHLDEEVANTNCMNCGRFRLSVQRCYDRSATKMSHVHPCPRLQLCLQPCALPRHHHICIASTFATITPLSRTWWIISSSCEWRKLHVPPHEDVSVHSSRLLLNTWKMMLCHS